MDNFVDDGELSEDLCRTDVNAAAVAQLNRRCLVFASSHS